jgi:Flp pilus assembly protein TadG
MIDRLVANSRGSAAVEMALSLPILLVLMFGSFELGNYFLSEHVVEKAVRDAARYGARLPMTNYNCAGPSVDATAQQNIQRVARTADPGGTIARLRGWTADSMATVTLTCDGDTSHLYVNKGVYSGFPNGGSVPVITVSATVPYATFFGRMGLGPSSLNLNSQSQAAVIGA